jgi:hypothetical protein
MTYRLPITVTPSVTTIFTASVDAEATCSLV